MPKRVEPLLTTTLLKNRYLHGVDLRDDNGKAMSNTTLSDKIDQATAWIEHELDILVRPEEFLASDDDQEKRDYRMADFYSWSYIKLHQYPVLEVYSVKLTFPSNNELIDYPVEWFKIYKESGILQLVPDYQNLPATYLQVGPYLPHFLISKAMVPQMVEVEYKAGFDDDKIPMDINDLIGLRASIDVLEIMGDLIIGAGIANQSVAMDGISQNVSTTASALYGGYSARVERYQKKLDKGLAQAKRFHKGVTMTSI